MLCINVYHLAIGHTAAANFTFIFMKQPHSMHWLVALSKRGHASQIAHRALATSSVAFSILGLIMSHGRVSPNFSLYSDHADIN